MIHAEIVTSQGWVTEKQSKKELAYEGGELTVPPPKKRTTSFFRQDDRKHEYQKKKEHINWEMSLWICRFVPRKWVLVWFEQNGAVKVFQAKFQSVFSLTCYFSQQTTLLKATTCDMILRRQRKLPIRRERWYSFSHAPRKWLTML